MGVPPVMDMITVTNPFSHPSKRLGFTIKGLIVLLLIIVLSLSSCQKMPSDREVIWGKAQDVTEDLHHRLQAGLFEIGKDPFICELIPHSFGNQKLRLPFKQKAGAYKRTRISWDRGSFSIRADDHALIVVYLDAEMTFSHVQIATVKGFQVVRNFREIVQHPIR